MENTTNNTQPEAVATPSPAPAPVQAAPTPTPAPSAAPAVKMELPKTTGKTPGGWNRFAGYDPKANKDKQGKRDRDRGPRRNG